MKLLPVLGLFALTTLAPVAIAGDDTPPVDPGMICPDAMSAKEITAVAQGLFPNAKIFSVELIVEDYSGWDDGWDDWGWWGGWGWFGRWWDDPAGGDNDGDNGNPNGDPGDDEQPEAYCYYEVQMMLGGLILDAEFDAVTGELLSVYTDCDQEKVAEVRKALKNSKTTLMQAASLAERRTQGGFVYEAKLDLSARGRNIDLTGVDDQGTVTLEINSKTKRTMHMEH